MATAYAHARYRDLLYKRGHGLPLWVPEGDHALPAQRVKGISIGDVGILTNDGGFEYLWNVHLPADHPYNNNKVPRGFVPLSDLDESRDLRKITAFHSENTTITTKSMKKRELNLKAAFQVAIAGGGAGFSFSAEGESGAVLMLPRGAVRVDAKNLVDYRQYAISNAESWYRYINGKDRNRGVQSGALCLVTGTDKCSSCRVASFAKRSNSQSIDLNFVAPGVTDEKASFTTIFSDDLDMESREKVVDVSEDSLCVFLRGFVISVRDDVLARWLGTPPKVKPLQGAPALPSFVGAHVPYTRGAEADFDSVERSDGQLLQKSPLAVLGDQLLNVNRNASIVVIHDDDCMLSTGGEDEGVYQRGGLQDLVEDNSTVHAAPQSYVVVVDGVCTLIPEKPTSITLTGDSVTLDNAVIGNLLHIQHHGSVAFPVTQAPPERDIERSEIVPTSSSPKQRLFALVIGIDLYKHAGPGLHNLKGAVADADAMEDFLTSTLGVDPSHVRNLRNNRATRDGIISALKALALDDRIQRDDAIVIFFAGHGSTTTVTGANGATSRRVEMIIPHDFLPKTTSNPHQQGIFDTTLAHLLTDLARAKGNNITAIFDSCHAGSSTRDPDILSRGVILPENYVALSSELPSVLPSEEEEEKRGSRHAAVASGYEYYGLASHVLLAACSRQESAYEYKGRGCFTKELLSKLRTATVPNMTYRSLMDQLEALPSQRPQCEGANVDRVLFDGKAPIRSHDMYSVRVMRDNTVTLDGGDILGITTGAEFDIYATKSPNAQPLCRLVATVIRPESCDLASVPGSVAQDIPQPAWAVQATPGLRKLGVFLRPEHELLFRHVKDELSTNHLIHFVDSNAQHELELQAVAADVLFVVADKRLNKIQLEETYPIQETEKICAVLEAAAHFFFHLNRFKPNAQLTNNVAIEAYAVREYPQYNFEAYGSNLIDGGEIPIIGVTQDEKVHMCGFKLTNNGSRNLYVWVFLFNPIDLSIDVVYAPGVAKSGSPPDHSILAGDCLTIGYGTSGTPPCTFTVNGVDTDVSYLKVYIASEPVVNLESHIMQKSPFKGTDDARKGGVWTGPAVQLPSQWGTILIPIVQEAAK